MAVLFESNGVPLISLRRCRFGDNNDVIDAAFGELIGRRTDGLCSWGYLLGVELGGAGYPRAGELESELHSGVLADIERDEKARFNFSFFKACRGQSPDAAEGVHYEGFHLDTHPDLADDTDLLRCLFNLSPYPRRFCFARTDRFRLQEAGVEVDRQGFSMLKLPYGTDTAEINIPGRTGGDVFMLRFWASIVPHVGINEANGYFLGSYETLKPTPI